MSNPSHSVAFKRLFIFEPNNPFKSSVDLIQECQINDELEIRQCLPVDALLKSAHTGLYNFLYSTLPYEVLDGCSLTEQEKNRSESAKKLINEYRLAYAKLRTEYLQKYNIEVTNPSLIFWRDYHDKTQVYLKSAILPPSKYVFNMNNRSFVYPLGDVDYLGIFTAIALVHDVQVSSTPHETPSDTHHLSTLIILANNVVQKLLHQADSFEIAKKITDYQFKKDASGGGQRANEKYNDLKNIFIQCFTKKVNDFREQHGHDRHIWKSKAACIRDLLQLFDKGKQSNNPKIEITEKMQQIQESITEGTFKLPDVRTFDKHLTAHLLTIPDSQRFFSRKIKETKA